jgi:hypothetical protein
MAVAFVGILADRHHSAAAARAPLPPLTATLPANQVRAWQSFPDYSNTVPVLVYHSVGGRASYLTVTRMRFAQQMRALKLAGFHPLTIAQYASFVRNGTAGLPPRPILITFDDGRLDAYRAANDVLKQYGFHATELVVPSWVSQYPKFSLSWPELRSMQASGIWDVQEHFGTGHEDVTVDKAGRTDGAFGWLRYIPASRGQAGHLESFTQFQRELASNMEWGEQQLEQKVPGFRPLSMAIPESDYGQNDTNDLRIPPFVLSWLDKHYPVVFGGDYLSRDPHPVFMVPAGRFSPRLSYRLVMGPDDSLPVLHCRLLDYVKHRPIQQEYKCLHLVQSVPVPASTPGLGDGDPDGDSGD